MRFIGKVIYLWHIHHLLGFCASVQEINKTSCMRFTMQSKQNQLWTTPYNIIPISHFRLHSTFIQSLIHLFIHSFVFRLKNKWQSCSNDNSRFQQERKTHTHHTLADYENWIRLFLMFMLMLISFRCGFFFSRVNVLSWSPHSKFMWLSQR